MQVVEEGTAKKARVAGLPIAGKTGTANKVAGGSYNQGSYRASFAGFFPADDPQIAMIVVLDEPRGYGGDAAAPVFQRVASRWIGAFPRLAERLAPSPPLPAPRALPVPNVAGEPVPVAQARLLAAGFTGVVRGSREGTFVQAQEPSREAVGAPGMRVTLTAAAAPDSVTRMPDVRGLSARRALAWLSRWGMQVTVQGSGAVFEQHPAPGRPLQATVLLECR